LFSEIPYAVALGEENVRNRCSNCFSKTEFPCPYACGFVYCGTKCADIDRQFHHFECESPTADKVRRPIASTRTRLLGRIIARHRVDKGQASLAEGLPSNVKVRKIYSLSIIEQKGAVWVFAI